MIVPEFHESRAPSAYCTLVVQQLRRNGTAIIALSSLFFGLMAISTRLLAGQVPAAQVVSVRFIVGIAGCLALFGLRRKGPRLVQGKLLLARGLFGGVAVLTYFFAIERLGAASATVLNYSSPIYAALFAAWFLGETASGLSRFGLLLATSGAMLVTFSTGSLETPLVPDVGAIAGVISAVAGGAAMTTIRKLRNDTDALTIFFAFCVVGLGVPPYQGALVKIELPESGFGQVEF